jgi:hypothetical protein
MLFLANRIPVPLILMFFSLLLPAPSRREKAPHATGLKGTQRNVKQDRLPSLAGRGCEPAEALSFFQHQAAALASGNQLDDCRLIGHLEATNGYVGTAETHFAQFIGRESLAVN